MPNALPESFASYLHEILGSNAPRFLAGLEIQRKNTIRVNTLKCAKRELLSRLNKKGYEFSELEFANFAVLVDSEPGLISKTIEHFLGHFYIQGVASMIPPLVLEPGPEDMILDISAAPGSKTTQIAQMMGNRGVLVANDADGKRIKTLAHNLDRMGILNTAMVNMGGERLGNLIPETFDKVLVDAPCSALGVIHKAPEAITNLNYLNKFSFMQEQLLISALKSVRIDGTIVYSTCTISPEENEKLLDRLLKKYPLTIESIAVPTTLESIQGLTNCRGEQFDQSLSKAVRLIPNKINPESFFIANLRKTDRIEVRMDKAPHENKKISFELVQASDRKIQRMIGYFEKTFGIDPQFWTNYLFQFKEDEICITSTEWAGRENFLNRIYTHRLGLRLARTRRDDDWKLSTNFAQIAHAQIKKNRIDLTDPKEIETYVGGGIIRRTFDVTTGGVVVFAEGSALGCGVMYQGNLKSQMPKSRKVIGIDW